MKCDKKLQIGFFLFRLFLFLQRFNLTYISRLQYICDKVYRKNILSLLKWNQNVTTLCARQQQNSRMPPSALTATKR